MFLLPCGADTFQLVLGVRYGRQITQDAICKAERIMRQIDAR
jgi:hypothetical protein